MVRALAAYFTAVFTALACFGMALAQNVGPVPASGAGTFGPPQPVSQNGHIGGSGAAPPTLSSGCGTGSTVRGTDWSFHVNTGTAADATCHVTFARAFSSRPTCILQGETNLAGYTTDNNFAGLTIGGALSSSRYHVECIAQPGGM